MTTLLGGLDTTTFLADYWQRKPLLIRQAIPGFESSLTAEELAGLALEPEIESRLILETDQEPGWELRQGPFTEADFTTLPRERWTLLVQDVEKHLPELVDVLDRFRFLPDWRIDDLMISHAAPGGSVGPHRDNYDVFLLQAQGSRKWMIDQRVDVIHSELPDAPLRLLDSFEATDSWVLEPGDMLYLPPGLPHHGIAEDDCQTWSIGFRAPRQQELLGDLLDRLVEAQDPDKFFEDPGRRPVEHPACIDDASLHTVRSQIRAALTLDDSTIDRWFASHVTEPKLAFAGKQRSHPIDEEDLLQRITEADVLVRNPASRIVVLDQDSGSWLYTDGHEWGLPDSARGLVHQLTTERRLSLADPELRNHVGNGLLLLVELINAGHWFFESDDEESEDDREH